MVTKKKAKRVKKSKKVKKAGKKRPAKRTKTKKTKKTKKKKARAAAKPTKAPAKKVLPKKKPATKIIISGPKPAQIAAMKAAETAKAIAAAKARMIGKVVHFYDKIGVAIVDLEKPIKLGDTVVLMRGDKTSTQRVTSLQIEHMPVAAAMRGDVVGMKVDAEISEGTLVLPL